MKAPFFASLSLIGMFFALVTGPDSNSSGVRTSRYAIAEFDSNMVFTSAGEASFKLNPAIVRTDLLLMLDLEAKTGAFDAKTGVLIKALKAGLVVLMVKRCIR